MPMRDNPFSRSTWESMSAWMRSTIPPTARHPTRISLVTAVFDVAVANQPMVSSKSRVNQEPCRAHGTRAATTPWSRQRTRTIGASRNTLTVPMSKPRQRRGPPVAERPWS